MDITDSTKVLDLPPEIHVPLAFQNRTVGELPVGLRQRILSETGNSDRR